MIAPWSTVLQSMTRGAMLVAATSLLAGCISLFPKTDPVVHPHLSTQSR